MVWAAKRVLSKLSRQAKILKALRECESEDIEDPAIYDRLAASIDEARSAGLSARDEVIRAERRRQAVFERMESRRTLLQGIQKKRSSILARGLRMADAVLTSENGSGTSAVRRAHWIGELEELVTEAKIILRKARELQEALDTCRLEALRSSVLPSAVRLAWLNHLGLLTGTGVPSQAQSSGLSPSAGKHDGPSSELGPLKRKKRSRRRRKSQYEEMLGLSSVFESSSDPRGEHSEATSLNRS